MGALTRAHDWDASILGPPHAWPQGLKTALRLLLTTQHPMFIWWGPELIQFYNDAYRRSIGPERHPSALGQRGRECWAEIWHLIGWQIEQVMSRGEATWHENHLVPITRNGKREDVYWTYGYSPLDEPTAPNGIGGVLVVCTETTQQVLSEQRLLLSTQALEESDRRKNEFLAMLAHELRNPLAPIQHATDILARQGVDHARSPMLLALMKRQLSHLTRLVDDLLDVSRITRGRIELKSEVLDLASLVRQAVETAQHQLDSKHHVLIVNLPREAIHVRADRSRIVQCISNVLTNAAKYTDDRGSIRIDVRRTDGLAEVAVTDNGIGLSAELLPQVFEIFVQGDRGLDRSQGGMGVGLAIVKQLMTLHGGDVLASSDGHGRGATFRLRLPAIAGPVEVPEAPEVASAAPRSVLIVDDNNDAAESLAMLLQLSGHTAQTAATGRAALTLLERHVFDTVLLDIGLPEMDGYEVARLIRARNSSQRLIALTGYGQPEDRERARAAGFEAHLVKPVDLDTLGALLA